MLVFAAIGVFGAGMLAIAAGIPIKEFGFGNTLILSGVLAWCTSAVMMTLWACFRDLRQAVETPARSPRAAEETPSAAPRPAPPEIPLSPSGWPESIPDRVPAPSAPPPPPPEQRAPRRNILFASNRKSRETNPREANPRETMTATETPIAPAPLAGPFETRAPTPSEEPRPAPRRIESPPPRTVRPVSTINPRDPVTAPPAAPLPPAVASPEAEPAAPRPAPARNDAATAAAVTVLKSGVVDGMAYWLYSDGSIEAQMPEGMMRFTSIDELRAHLDKRP